MLDLVSGTASQLYPVRRKPTAAYTRNVLGNPDKYSLFKGTVSGDGMGLGLACIDLNCYQSESGQVLLFLIGQGKRICKTKASLFN
jgi:hypothetical protein